MRIIAGRALMKFLEQR